MVGSSGCWPQTAKVVLLARGVEAGFDQAFGVQEDGARMARRVRGAINGAVVGVC